MGGRRFRLSVLEPAVSATVGVVSIVLIFLGLSDGVITADFLRLSGSLPASPLVIAASARAIRILLLIVVLLLVALLVSIFAHGRSASEPTSANQPSVLSQAEGVKLAASKLGHGVTEVCIWGFSLQWATPLYRHLREHPYPNVTVRLFVAGPTAWSSIVDYPNVSSATLRTRRETALVEWLSLVSSQRVKEVLIYESLQLPNEWE